MTAHEVRHGEPEDTANVSNSIAPQPSEHDTLKYHLLGPSLTKAGQDSVDQQKVSEIIYNASKGSKYFSNEEQKDKNLTQKIEKILARKRHLERVDLASDRRRADDYITELELSRDLSQTVVHIDCDAFYAAVEELDRPELRDVPMAVGKGVLTTCNYHARKFGCRSGMAGFVAMKLCPQLICLPLNFEKYTAKAQEVREILADYDPQFESASIDEAYLNITEYCKNNDIDPEEAVSQMRREVREKCHITISAGIAANAKIAKIASNRNKPDGQCRVANDRNTILAFMRDLPTRKVNGIGRVFERELDAIGVKTCGDIHAHRAYLPKLFGEKAFHFLMQCYLGLGRTKVQPAEDYERKSVGTEGTFKDMNDKTQLRERLRHTAEELEKDLTRTQFKGRTLVLKIKLHTYEVFTRQVIPPKAVSTADDLYNYSLPMLAKLEKEIPGMTLRLMGLRCTHLVSTKKVGLEFFGLQPIIPAAEDSSSPLCFNKDKDEFQKIITDAEGWQIWPETEFEEAARQEWQDEMDEMERLSQEEHGRSKQASNPTEPSASSGHQAGSQSPLPPKLHGRVILPNPAPQSLRQHQRQRMDSGIGFSKPPTRSKTQDSPPSQPPLRWTCPICARPQEASDRAFNSHVDFCLSRQTIKDAAAGGGGAPAAPAVEEPEGEMTKAKATATGSGKENEGVFGSTAVGTGNGSANGRGRPKGKRKGDMAGAGPSGGRGNKRLFFSMK